MRIDLSYFLYPELLPTGTEPENHGTVPRYLGEYHGGFAGDGDAVLLLFVHSAVHGIYQCRPPPGRYFFFLISSPMVDLGSLVLLISIFGYRIAVAYVVFGLIIAVIGGSVIERLHMEAEIEDFIRQAPAVSEAEIPQLTRRDRLDYAKEQMTSTFRKVFPYILIGVGIGALIHNWIPEQWVEDVLGRQNPLGVILATLVGAPMYADIFGSIPIAEALLGKGAQLGAVLSFMMAVTTLSLPSLILLRKAIKPKLLGVFILTCVIGIILVGYSFNALQGFLL